MSETVITGVIARDQDGSLHFFAHTDGPPYQNGDYWCVDSGVPVPLDQAWYPDIGFLDRPRPARLRLEVTESHWSPALEEIHRAQS